MIRRGRCPCGQTVWSSGLECSCGGCKRTLTWDRRGDAWMYPEDVFIGSYVMWTAMNGKEYPDYFEGDVNAVVGNIVKTDQGKRLKVKSWRVISQEDYLGAVAV